VVVSIKVDLSGVRQLQREMNALKGNLRAERSAMIQGWKSAFMTSFWDAYAGEVAPGNGRTLATMYRGQFVRGINVRVDPFGRWMTVENFSEHANVVEEGTSPGYTPDFQDIREWVMDKLNVAGDSYEIDKVTRRVIRNIQTRGLAPHLVIQRALNRPGFEGQLAVIAERAYTAAIDRTFGR